MELEEERLEISRVCSEGFVTGKSGGVSFGILCVCNFSLCLTSHSFSPLALCGVVLRALSEARAEVELDASRWNVADAAARLLQYPRPRGWEGGRVGGEGRATFDQHVWQGGSNSKVRRVTIGRWKEADRYEKWLKPYREGERGER